MKDQFLVPDVVRNLSNPFDSTWCEPRRSGIDRARTRELVEVLDPILAGLEVVPAVDHDDPPIDFFLWPDRGLRLMARAMPTLSSVTFDAVDRRLRELGADLTAKEVKRVGHYWVRALLETCGARSCGRSPTEPPRGGSPSMRPGTWRSSSAA